MEYVTVLVRHVAVDLHRDLEAGGLRSKVLLSAQA
jgi:hypothetical protein